MFFMSKKGFNIAAYVIGMSNYRVKSINSKRTAISFLLIPRIANSGFLLEKSNHTKLFRLPELERTIVLLRTEKFTLFFFQRTFFFFLFFSLFVLRLLFLFSFPFSF